MPNPRGLLVIHIDGLVIWLLMGFMGAVYWFLPNELGREVEGVRLANWMFWILCAALVVVFAVFIFVQYGPGDEPTLWLINQGRKYVEAPRWAAIGVVCVVAVFVYNVVATTWKARRMTGILLVLLTLRVAAIGNGRSLIDLATLTAYVMLFALGRYVYRLYIFGHNLDPKAEIHIQPFMTVIVGTKQVANFTVSAYPQLGGVLMFVFVSGIALITAWHLWKALPHGVG